MNKKMISVLLVLISIASANSAHAFGRHRPTPTPTPTPVPVPYSYTAEEIETVQLIEQHRLSMGLGGLTKNDFISYQCLNHNGYMIGKDKPSHDYFTNRSNAIIKELKATAVGEIIAYNYSTPRSALTAWLNSPGHRSAIENAKYSRAGCSIRSGTNGRKFYTVIFSN